ncbi:FtsX-like permease family protein [Myxococcota bacterium]|jgi:ABC-type lipoprotein release transport system permease subunit|nr:FtsX-like permease family protein [Myxococcota bacterium]
MGTFSTLVRMAGRNLVQGGRRVVLLGMAMVLVSMLLVLLDSLAAGLEASMVNSATTLASGHVNVGGFFKVTSGTASPVVADGPKIRAIVEREVPELDYQIDRVRGWARLVSERASFWGGLLGIDVEEERGLRSVLQISEGSFDALKQPDTILLFEQQAKRLEAKVGDTLTISAPTMGGVNNTVDVRVGAIAKDVGFMSAINLFMPKATIRQLYQMKPEATGAVQLYLKNEADASGVMERLRPKLEAEGFRLMDLDPRPFWMKFDTVTGQDWVGQKLDLTTWREEVSFLLWILTGFAALRWLLLGVILLLVVVGIMNTMYMSIRERTREIGTMRAIGMSRGRVLGLFLLEALALGIGASALGAGLGVVIALSVNAAEIKIASDAFMAILMNDQVYLKLTVDNVVFAVALITGISVFAALRPARRAARMRPVGALHQVG